MLLACALSIFAATPCAMPPAPGDDPSLVQDFCAITALPVRAGISSVGDPADYARVQALRDGGDWSNPDQRGWPAEALAAWDRCAHIGSESTFTFSRDRQYAFIYGGGDGGVPLGGSWGECYYAKEDGKWRVLACIITAMS